MFIGKETEERPEKLPQPKDGWLIGKQDEAVPLEMSVTLNIKDSTWKT